MRPGRQRAAVAAVGIATAVLVVILGHNSLGWIGRTFPGFLLLENRVVPSIALPEWVNATAHFQHQVVAVDGLGVSDAPQAYARVAERPAGSPIHYTFRRPDGSQYEAIVPSRLFSRADYVFLFGSFLLSGGAFLLAGALVSWMKSGDPAATALLCCGVAIGLFALTALDLYGPYWFFRLHVIGEVLVGPVFLHLALVFPTHRVREHLRLAVACVYAPFVLLIAWYELALASPSLYSRVHGIATLGQSIGGVAIIAAVCFDLATTHSPLVRRRLAVVGLGTLAGFLVPTVLMAGSGLLGGSIAVNAAGLTAFFFPLALAYGILKDDLFQIDLILRQAISYGILVFLIAATYFFVLYGFGVLIPGQLSSWSPVVLACLNFGLLFLLAPVRERIQGAINRVFFRPGYQVDQALSSLGLAMASARTLGDVAVCTRDVLASTCAPRSASLLLVNATGQLHELQRDGEVSALALRIEADIAQHLEHDLLVARYQWDDRGSTAARHAWEALDAEVLVPIRASDRTIAVWRLSAKRSGRAYTADDSAFLRAASPQIALALSNAIAFSELAELNTKLESKVHERTHELHVSNAELNESLDKLREAYGKLEQSQASLLRADRLATLGRLTAGIAHEMNTPLSAVMNALKVLQDLGREYALSIDNPTVQPENHHEIADEIVTTAAAAAKWAQKAGSFISSVKAHGRETPIGAPQRIVLSNVVTETRELLAHRLRAAACQIDLVESSAGATVTGDSGRLGQVLLNLCANAIDAYEDAGIPSGRVEIRVDRVGERIRMSVRDWAGGIPPHVLPHVFDELYTTKGPGRGTGLGLWIARNLIEQGFGGSLTVETQDGVGSCFLLDLPCGAAAAAAAAKAEGMRQPVAPAGARPILH